MRKTILVLLVSLAASGLCAQSPVKWSFSSKKLDDKSYEIHLTANIEAPWKIYSQYTPEGGPVPTSFQFTQNPLIITDGNVKEVGAVKKTHEDVFGVDVLYFKEKVDFVQVIKLKSRAKTKINGKLEFMACNEVQCLPPAAVNFSIDLK